MNYFTITLLLEQYSYLVFGSVGVCLGSQMRTSISAVPPPFVIASSSYLPDVTDQPRHSVSDCQYGAHINFWVGAFCVT